MVLGGTEDSVMRGRKGAPFYLANRKLETRFALAIYMLEAVRIFF